MFKRILFNAFIFLIIFNGFAIAASAIDMKEGLWEITTKMEMPGMPMAMPPVIHKQCLKKEAFIPQSGQADQGCGFKNLKIQGNTVTYEIDCDTEDGKMTGHGKVTYSGTIMEGEMEMLMSQENMRMKSIIRGRYIGECN